MRLAERMNMLLWWGSLGDFLDVCHQIGVAIALQQFDILRYYAVDVLRSQICVRRAYPLCLRHILEVVKSMSV